MVTKNVSKKPQIGTPGILAIVSVFVLFIGVVSLSGSSPIMAVTDVTINAPQAAFEYVISGEVASASPVTS